MATGFEDQAKINALPKDDMHCYPANEKQIKTRRVATIVIAIVGAALTVLGLCLKTKSIPLAVIGILAVIICALVYAQSFLIEKYRVAVDYKNKEIVLRYRFSLIKIPFEAFDARDGEPDRAEAMLNNAKHQVVNYLILDNVFEEACFQTSTGDLASKEDFNKLRDDAFAIAEAYGARNSEDAIKQQDFKDKVSDKLKSEIDDKDIDDIVASAMDEHKKN